MADLTIEQKIAQAQDKLIKLQTEAKAAQEENINQQKYLLGSFVMDTLGSKEKMAAFAIGDKQFANFLTRVKDRKYFGLK
jgi:hypothetical protein